MDWLWLTLLGGVGLYSLYRILRDDEDGCGCLFVGAFVAIIAFSFAFVYLG